MPAELQKLLVLFSQRVTSQSAHYIRPGGMTPPKPPAGPVVTWNGHSPFSDSRHDLETAVAQDPADLHVVVPDLR